VAHPLGRGSRATIVGGARAGKTEALRRLASTLSSQEASSSPSCSPARARGARRLEGRRPRADDHADVRRLGDAQAQAIERAIDTAKRIAARGGHAVVLVDTLSSSRRSRRASCSPRRATSSTAAR
jgi:transcription termination factor Rho